MNANTQADVYRNQKVMTAPPEELVMMLYNGAIRFASDCVRHLNEKKYLEAHQASLRAQAIISELMANLDMQYDISRNILALYEYAHHNLMVGNARKDAEPVRRAIGILTEFRDTWAEAVKKARLEKRRDNDAVVYGR